MSIKGLKRLFILGFVIITMLISSVFIYNSISARNVLYWGSRNDDVRIVQRRLSQWGYYDGNITGIYGSQTQSAVRDFQRRNNLRVDGIVGPETWAAIGFEIMEARQAEARPAVSTNVNRTNELDMLARIINAEARGEPYEGQVAVGAVVLNRIQSSSFPNSLSGVIYQPLAFESVADGQFYQTPSEQSRRAARAALNGYDPTYGAEFFWNPGKPVNPWVWGRPIVRTIGDHVFAR